MPVSVICVCASASTLQAFPADHRASSSRSDEHAASAGGKVSPSLRSAACCYPNAHFPDEPAPMRTHVRPDKGARGPGKVRSLTRSSSVTNTSRKVPRP